MSERVTCFLFLYVMGLALIVPCYFLAVLPDTIMSNTCYLTHVNFTDTFCTKATRCQCTTSGCTTDLCTVKTTRNETGNCCGSFCTICTGRKASETCVDVQETCVSTLGACYSFEVFFTLDHRSYQWVLNCELDDVSCRNTYYTLFVNQNDFTCYYRHENTERLYFKKPSITDQYIHGWFGVASGIFLMMVSFIVLFSYCKDKV